MTNRSGYARDLPVVAERSRALSLPADFMRMSGTGRLNAILNLPEPDKVVRRLREDEFAYLVNGIGLEDAGCLMPYASGRQRRVLVDMDVWTGLEFVPARFDNILEVAKESGLEFTLRMLKDLDPELLVLSLFKRAQFHTLEEAEDLEFEEGTWFMTPDNVFVVECKTPDDVPSVRGELDLIYAISVAFAHRLIQSGRWDTVSSLEHQSYKYRTDRLSETGFPDEDNAYELYEPFDFEAFRSRVLTDDQAPASVGATAGEPLALAVVGTSGGLFFWKVLGAAGPGDLNPGYILSQTMNLVNRVLGSGNHDLSDTDVWESTSAHTLTVVSVGLEAVCGDDVIAGLRVLRRSVPLELYKAGIEFMRPANILARQVVADVGGLANLVLFGEAAAMDIDAVAAFPPRCPPSLCGGSSRDFVSCDEVVLATTMMKKYKAVVQFASGVLGFVPTRKPGGTESAVLPTFENVVATAWAHQILGGGLSFAPLSRDDILKLRRLAFDGESLRPSLRVAREAEDEYAAAVREFLNSALDHVEESLGGLTADFDIAMIGDCLLTV